MTDIKLPREKKVKHLTLHRPSSRAMSGREFNALSADERLTIIRGTEGRRKYQLLLESADVEMLVQRLPAQEIYLLLRELGAEYAAELVPMVSTEQFTTLLDLDCWHSGIFDEKKALHWLELLMEGGEEKILRTVDEIEYGLLVLLLKKLIIILRSPEDFFEEDARQEGAPPEGGYEIDYRDAESARIMGGFLHVMLRRNHDLYLRLLEAVRWEHESLLEEEVLNFHSGRMQDLGFPDPFEALSVFSYLDPDAFDAGRHRKEKITPGEETEAPGFILTIASPRNLLADILAGGVSSETCWELTFLLNRVMVADRIDPGDFSQVQEEMGDIYACLNLALEYLAGTDVDRAVHIFDDIYLHSLFRLGFSLAIQLQRQAGALRKSSIDPYLDGPLRAFVDALARKKPRYYEGLENQERGGERPFTTMGDLGLARQWLERLEVCRRLFEDHFPFLLPQPADLDLTGCFPDDPLDLTLSDFFLTALANRLLGRDFLPMPVTRREISGLHALVCHEGKVASALRTETARWLETLEPGAGFFSNDCLGIWQEEFCTIEVEALDSRYIGGLIVRLED
jgi:hypothetical protein